MNEVRKRKPKARRSRPRAVGRGKQLVVQAMEELPADATIEEILDELVTHARIRRALREEREGQLIPHATVVRDLQRWRSR